MKRKVLIVGSNTIHTFRYINLIRDRNEALLITNQINPECFVRQKKADFRLVKNPLKISETIKQIEATIEAYKPDVIHVHQANSYAFYTLLANKKYKKPVVLTAWGTDVLVLPKNILLKNMVRYNLKHANIITADSQEMAGIIRDLSKRAEVKVLTLGVDDIYLQPKFEMKDKQKIIFSCRLHNPLYRIDKIINAFIELRKDGKYHDWKLVIAGKGSQTEELMKKVEASGLEDQVDFVGFIDQKALNYYYKLSSIYVSIPTSDGTSVSLLEAMASGCIPVLSNLKANKEWVERSKNGIISKDVEALGNDLAEAIQIYENQDEFEWLAAHNYNLVAEKASVTSVKDAFNEIYDTLVS